MHPITSQQVATLKAAEFRREAERYHLQARARRAAKQHASASEVRSPVRFPARSPVRSPLRRLRAVLKAPRVA
jgi:hypothetical protein